MSEILLSYPGEISGKAHPREEASKHAGRLMDEGWRATYSDGSGAEGHAASAAHMMTRRAEPTRTSSTYSTSAPSQPQGTQSYKAYFSHCSSHKKRIKSSSSPTVKPAARSYISWLKAPNHHAQV